MAARIHDALFGNSDLSIRSKEDFLNNCEDLGSIFDDKNNIKKGYESAKLSWGPGFQPAWDTSKIKRTVKNNAISMFSANATKASENSLLWTEKLITAFGGLDNALLTEEQKKIVQKAEMAFIHMRDLYNNKIAKLNQKYFKNLYASKIEKYNLAKDKYAYAINKIEPLMNITMDFMKATVLNNSKEYVMIYNGFNQSLKDANSLSSNNRIANFNNNENVANSRVDNGFSSTQPFSDSQELNNEENDPWKNQFSGISIKPSSQNKPSNSQFKFYSLNNNIKNIGKEEQSNGDINGKKDSSFEKLLSKHMPSSQNGITQNNCLNGFSSSNAYKGLEDYDDTDNKEVLVSNKNDGVSKEEDSDDSEGEEEVSASSSDEEIEVNPNNASTQSTTWFRGWFGRK